MFRNSDEVTSNDRVNKIFVYLRNGALKSSYLHHITGYAVVQYCCNDDQQSRWILTTCRFGTCENFITKIGYFDYIVRCNTDAEFMGIGPEVSALLLQVR